MKVGVVWDFLSARSLGTGVVIDPRCPAILRDGKPCGRPATVRRTRLLRSAFWCPVHVWPDGYTDAAWNRYRALWPDALERAFIEWLP